MASLFGGNNPFGNLHSDVLNAEPEDDAGRASLTEELKSRAKVAMQQKNFPVAEVLYSKALEVNPGTAILFANRAAARHGLGHFKEALDDAEGAAAADPTYAKALFRKGQACLGLKRFADAVAAFEQGSALEPDNKLFKSLATKAREAQAKAEAEAEDEPPPLQEAPPRPTPPPQVRKPKPAAGGGGSGGGGGGSNGSTSGSSNGHANADGAMRGYKLTSDGRKTTFFNNELDEEAKRLIGDIQPKRLDEAVGACSAAPALEGSSAWNTAGTWEERTMTSWAKPRLEELLVGVEAPLPNGLGVVRTTKVKSLEGDASITMIRSKKKYLFDFQIQLEWAVTLPEGPCKGTLTYPDVTPDCEGDYEAQYEVDRSTPPAARALLDAYVRTSAQGLQPAISAAVQTFVEEFSAML